MENHEDTLTFLGRYLESQGHEVRTARDMQSALAQWEEGPVDVLICDIGLPDGDGWELMRQIREKGHDPYGVAMSGYGMKADQDRSQQAGFHHHLTKPFLPEELESVLSQKHQTSGRQ